MTSETHSTSTTGYSQEVKVIDKSLTTSQEKSGPKRFHNDKLMLLTLLIATIVTILLYSVPDWVFLEIPTRDIISKLLEFVGIENSLIPSVGHTLPEKYKGVFPFLEATDLTPGIYIPETGGDYWIVKACTGMQAGGLLIAIIMVTEAPWIAKIRASIAFFLALFIGNALRIAFHLWCVTILVTQLSMNHEEAFYWAHDVSSKVIGFFGTIVFAFIIERMGVPIIDQFADWLDWLWYRANKIYSYLFH
ncbi:MAG: exosortase/archaeosortase family protein [Candidatus Heimdallarchaeota archaeon]|nr:MAG: exosortase/archaeosortase family protein [Candidatus Heimdallarchaeota archaeon]